MIYYYIMNKYGDILELNTCTEDDWIMVRNQAFDNCTFACFVSKEEYNKIKQEINKEGGF